MHQNDVDIINVSKIACNVRYGTADTSKTSATRIHARVGRWRSVPVTALEKVPIPGDDLAE